MIRNARRAPGGSGNVEQEFARIDLRLEPLERAGRRCVIGRLETPVGGFLALMYVAGYGSF